MIRRIKASSIIIPQFEKEPTQNIPQLTVHLSVVFHHPTKQNLVKGRIGAYVAWNTFNTFNTEQVNEYQILDKKKQPKTSLDVF